MFKRLLLATLLSVGMSSAAIAANATFTWTKPVPMFSAEVPPSWTIDEYKIYCATDAGEEFTVSVPGYETESYDATGMPVGNTSCYMTSFSVAAGVESEPSITVVTFVHDGAVPNAPAGFNFSVKLQ